MLISVPAWLQRYLLNMGPVRAFYLFFGATLLGGASVLYDIGMPLVPIAVVAAYGGLLWLGQTRHFTQLSTVTKDSPYFLGFTLTLLALIGIFARMSQSGATRELMGPYLFRGAATALGTTIVGLILRQLLHASDPIEHDRDEMFQTLAQQLKNQTKSFAHSQRRLVELIEEFTKTREEMFTREEKVFNKYLDRLDEASNSLADMEERYNARFDTALQAVTSSAEETANQAEGAAEMLKASSGELATVIENYKQALNEVLRENRRVIETARHELREDSQNLAEVTQALSRTIEESLSRVGGIPDDHEKVISKVSDAAQEVADPIGRVGRDLEKVDEGLRSVMQKLEEVPGEVQASVEGIDRITRERERVVTERLKNVITDLEALDEVVDQTVELLERRIERGISR